MEISIYPQAQETSETGVHEARQLAFEDLLRAPRGDVALSIDEYFPEHLASRLSQAEAFNKHLFRPNTYLHKWWARRCGTTFRNILKQFVSDDDRRDYYAAGGLEGKVVLDPMMGGGTTLHEAIRLGASVIGADVDPIPIAQARASLTQVPLSELRHAFDRLFALLRDELAPYFQSECPHCTRQVDVQYFMHGVRKQCRCGEIVQIDQFELRHESGRTLCIHPATWAISDGSNEWSAQPTGRRLLSKGVTGCPDCGQKYRELLDEPYYARYVCFANVGTCPEHGLFMRPPGAADLVLTRKADALRMQLDFDPTGDFAVNDGVKSGDLVARNIGSYLDTFSSRQLLYLYHAIHLLQEFSGVIKLNLGLLISTSLEFNSLLCGYKGWAVNRPGAIRHVFALHAYSFPYTALENNPVNPQKSSGNLQQLFSDRIERGRNWAIAPVERRIGYDGTTQQVKIPGEYDGGVEVTDQKDLGASQAFWLIHGDSRRLPISDHSVDYVVTDPPYYDSVQYSDLAAYFRVWLARLLPDEINWTYDESQSAVAAKATTADTPFMNVIAGIFQECGRVLKREAGRMVFTFHNWDPNAWAELTIGLRTAGFRLTNAYVVISENPISVHIRNLRAIKHDTILVLTLDSRMPGGRWAALKSIDTGDSETFCRQCGAGLGWLLESQLTDSEIRTTWIRLIREGK
jgi:DNA modification methylase